MRVGSKTASACWLAILTVGLALVAFGLGDDPGVASRDAITELELIAEGPTPDFIEYCRAFEAERDQPILLPIEKRRTRDEWARSLLSSRGNPDRISEDFHVSGLLWCPLPLGKMTVREALEVVGDSKNFSTTIWPHTDLLEALTVDPSSEIAGSTGSKFAALQHEIADGATITRIDVTSDPLAGSHMLFSCSNAAAVFEPFTAKAPASPLQVIVALSSNQGNSVYCLGDEDRPSSIARLYGTSGFSMEGFHRSYYSRKVLKSSTYSLKQAAERGFDFPAVRAKIKDIGGLTVSEALSTLRSEEALQGQSLSVFGVELPIIPSLLSFCLSLPVLTALFMAGFRTYGIRALPELVRGTPVALSSLATIGTICILPFFGFVATGRRLEYAMPALSLLLQTISFLWLSTSAAFLVSAFWHLRRAASLAKT